MSRLRRFSSAARAAAYWLPPASASFCRAFFSHCRVGFPQGNGGKQQPEQQKQQKRAPYNAVKPLVCQRLIDAQNCRQPHQPGEYAAKDFLPPGDVMRFLHRSGFLRGLTTHIIVLSKGDVDIIAAISVDHQIHLPEYPGIGYHVVKIRLLHHMARGLLHGVDMLEVRLDVHLGQGHLGCSLLHAGKQGTDRMQRLYIHLTGCLAKGAELILLHFQPLPVILKNTGDGVGVFLHGFDFVHGKQRPAEGGNLLELRHQLLGYRPDIPVRSGIGAPEQSDPFPHKAEGF